MSEATPDGISGSPSHATGDPDIDAALERLAELDALPVTEHLDRLDQAHEVLHRSLQTERPG